MRKCRRVTAFVLTLMMVLSIMPLVAFAAEPNSTDEELSRYTVLILDTSGSMQGTPSTVQKEAATKFCNSVTNAEGANYVAIVKLNTSSSVGCEFTSDLDTLTAYIRSIPASGGTNINQALEKAEDLLDAIPDDGSSQIIKNIVLCSDGLPESGTITTSGQYTSADHSNSYKYANTAYNTAAAIKEKNYKIYSLGFFHSLSGNNLSFGQLFMSDIASEGCYYEVTDVDDLEFTFGEIAEELVAQEIQLSIRYSEAVDDVCPELPATYSDKYFSGSSYNYNHDLAWLTLCLELSSWTADESTWGEDDVNDSALAKSRYANIASAYEQMGFDQVKDFNYGTTLNDSNDKVAFTIATKSNVCGATLMAVVIRGGGYGAEWSSNFNVGSGEFYHDGFNRAAEGVYEQVLAELAQIDGNVKLWITGYSRGAAAANLLSAKLDDYASSSSQFDANDIFAYSFATPQGVTTNKNTTDALYQNIYNIVNPGDVVPLVAPSGWKFTRYGVTRYFDANASTDVLDAVFANYVILTGDYSFNAKSNLQQSAAGSALMKIILNAFPTVKSSDKIQNVLEEFLEFTNTKKYEMDDSGNGSWTSIDFDDFYLTLIDRYGNTFWTSFQYAHSFLTVTTDGKLLMSFADGNQELENYFHLFFTLCEIHGIDSCELAGTLVSLFNSENILAAATAYFNLPDGIGGVKTAHTPSVYLAWMGLKEEYAFGNTAYSNVRGTTIVAIACPVDIVVYDQNDNAVATITDHQLIDADIPVRIDGETTELYFAAAADTQYTIKIVPTDSGQMTYTVTESDIFENVINRVNYYNIPLNVNRVFTGNIETSQEYTDGKYDLSCVEGGETVILAANEVLTSDYTVTLSVDTSGNGTVVGAGDYIKGDTVQLKAYSSEGYEFDGWYSNDQLISDEDTYRICVLEDTGLLAVFSLSKSEDGPSIPPTYPSEASDPDKLEIAGLPFHDESKDDWSYSAVEYVYTNGLMSGTSPTTFAPDMTTTRGMIVTILHRLEGKPEAEASTFTDVAADQYYTDAVNWAAANHIVEGYNAETFGPNDPITREQMAAILYRYAQYKGYDVSKGESYNILSYTDFHQIDDWAISAMQWACGEGLISGMGSGILVPKGNATRAQVAMILMRFCENVVK